jgi:DNA-binding transcriptional ArsR family regulator
MDPSGTSSASDTDDIAARRDVALEWLAKLDPASDSWEADLAPVTMTMIDALLDADAATLQELAEPLRDALADLFADGGHAGEIRGYLLGALAATRWGLRRLPDPADVEFAGDSHAGQMLETLSHHASLTSSDLRKQLGTSESQLSRVGRNLLARGLVMQRRAGRYAIWELSPQGRQVVRQKVERHDSGVR